MTMESASFMALQTRALQYGIVLQPAGVHWQAHWQAPEFFGGTLITVSKCVSAEDALNRCFEGVDAVMSRELAGARGAQDD